MEAIPVPSTRVYVLYTGGTFAMLPTITDQPSSPLAPAKTEDLRNALAKINHNPDIIWDLHLLTEADGSEIAPLDSSAVGPSHWLTIAKAIERVYHLYDGFVVIHGTDTMAYTASALSFLLVNLAKPVVVTGSQSPIFAIRTDATLNFINALYVAGHGVSGVPLVPEVTVCFGDHLYRGNRTRKVSVSSRSGFASPNYPPLGTFGESIQINTQLVREKPDKDLLFYVHNGLDDRVMDITLYPGVKGSQLRPFFEHSDLRGFILRTFGSGTTPHDPELLEAIAQAASQGKILLVTTQCLEGGVDLGRYHASTKLLEPGIISGFDITPEAALTKLMWVLALEEGPEREAEMQTCQRGEQSYEQYIIRFTGCHGKTSETFSRRLAAPVSSHILQRALIRIYDCDAKELRFFLDATGIDPKAASDNLRCLGSLSVKESQGVIDVTASLAKLITPNQPLRFTVTAAGETFCLGRMDVSILTQAR